MPSTIGSRAHCAALAAALCATLGAGSALAQEKVSFNLSWLPQGSTGGVLVAMDQGFYKEVGLEVEAPRGYGGARTVNEIDQGKFDFGYGDPVSIVQNRAQGGKTRLIGAINTRWPANICFVPTRHKVANLDNLKGLSFGGGSASPVQALLPAWLELNGKPRDHIKLLKMDPTVIDAALIEGKIDLAECWHGSNRPLLMKKAKDAGQPVESIRYSDFKLDVYGSGVVATDDFLAKRPDTARRFLRATYKGYDFILKNPERSADIIVKMHSVLDREVVLQQIRDINELIIDKDVAGRGLGFIREDRAASTVKFIDAAYDLKGKVKANEIFTNSFLN
jgi:NitT/TauT family transport system substrate-binding protein